MWYFANALADTKTPHSILPKPTHHSNALKKNSGLLENFFNFANYRSSQKYADIVMASFGHFIKEEREKNGWTQTDFGAKIGINAFAISKIENGFQKFSKTKLKELAKLLEMEFQKVNDLFYADKFAVEAYKNQCSENVFVVADDNVKYLKITNAKQAKKRFDQ